MLRLSGTFLVVFFSVVFCFEPYNISYSPYGINTKPSGSQPVISTMVRDFEIMSLNFESLVFYGLDEYPYYVVDSLAEAYGMKYWAGLYYNGGAYSSRLSRLRQARSYLNRSDSLGHVGLLGLIYGYNTGNLESILQEMDKLSSEYPNVPLTHLEYVDIVKREQWFYSDSLIDVVPVCVFPDQDIRREDLSGDAVMSYVRDQYEDICSIYPNKRVVLFEVGISTYSIQSSEEDQANFLSPLVSWIEENDIDAYLFELRDQFWKSNIDQGYGLFDTKMGAKRFALDNLAFPYKRKSISFGDSVFACFYSDVFKTKSREGDVVWSANSEYIEETSGYSDYIVLGNTHPSEELDLCNSFVSADVPFGMLLTNDTLNERPYYKYAKDAGFVLLEYESYFNFLNILQEIRDIAPLVPVGLLSSHTGSLRYLEGFSPYFDFIATQEDPRNIDSIKSIIDSFSTLNSIPVIPCYSYKLEEALEKGNPFIYTGQMSTFIKDIKAVSISAPRINRRVVQQRPEYFTLSGRRVVAPIRSGRLRQSGATSVLIRTDQLGTVGSRKILQVH